MSINITSNQRNYTANPVTPEPACGNFRPAARNIRRRVLVVDDEPLIRWSVAETLRRLNFDVEVASDAASALWRITSQSAFDVIVLDLRLPDMNDLSLLATIRQIQPEASVVLMTAYSTDDVLERAVALGAECVLPKPFELGALIAAVYGATDASN